MTTTMSASAARDRFAEILDRVDFSSERHVIERRGKAKAAVVSMKDLEILEELENRLDLAEALEALKESEAAETISLAEIKENLGL